MQDSSPRRVAIIGGGLSGLATAAHLHLLDPSIDLTVLESADRLGGVITTETADGFLIDHGADMFASNPPHALQLCEQLGVTDQLIQPQMEGRGANIVHHGKLVPIPDGFVLMRATKILPMLTTPLLSVSGKLRLAAEIFKPNNVSETDQSVADFVRDRMGNEVLQRIVGPLVSGIYTADVEKLSLLATMNPIAEMVRQHGSLAKATLKRRRKGEDSSERNSAGARYNQFRAFRSGMVGLINSIAQSLPAGAIHLNSPVRSIRQTTLPSENQRNGSQQQPTWEIQSDAATAPFDHIVVGTPARIASTILQPHAPIAAEQLSAIESASTAIVVLGVRRADILRPVTTFGFVVPPIENRRILAGSFASTKFAGRAPEDHVLVRVFIGGALQSELLENDDESLIQIAREELNDLIGLQGDPVVSRVVRWNQAMPQYHVGHLDRVRQIDQSIADVPGLSLISNAMHGVGIAPVIKAAKSIADGIVKT
ncbi:protoporphyrinogen oxidase [Planctomycetes bacterium K23_9]|uniref:Coproporphyrinogen III oxidase n=1 Tax=Stieleria marina TaxID=1930275 RepID=A0A517NPI7_9BACT|nr:Protoporphyrinogen oxidase [Planctomycetes bacterium K23_9]